MPCTASVLVDERCS